MQFAPIAVFVFNRPEHTAKMLASLEENTGITDSPIFFFADGPRFPSDFEAINRTRNLVSEWGGRFRCQFFFSDVNRGLAKSIVSGIDVVFEKYDRVIVIEDDLIFSSEFLSYINNALNKYCDDENIWQVSAYMFPIQSQSRDVILLPLISTWGWGTWKSRWKNFPRTRSQILNLTNGVKNWRSFDLDGSYPYRRRLIAQLRSTSDSWGIYWYLALHSGQAYAVFPPTSLVENIGNDGSGTHSRVEGEQTKVKSIRYEDFIFKSNLHVDPLVFSSVKKYLRSRYSLVSVFAIILHRYVREGISVVKKILG